MQSPSVSSRSNFARLVLGPDPVPGALCQMAQLATIYNPAQPKSAMNAWNALGAVSEANFSPQCGEFLANSTGDADLLNEIQGAAGQADLINAATATTRVGATEFPGNPSLANAAQANANAVTGLANATLAQLFAANPLIQAVGQYKGNNIYYNAGAFAGMVSGMAWYTIFHELLHNLGFDDAQLESEFGVPASVVATQGSQSITFKLMAECGH